MQKRAKTVYTHRRWIWLWSRARYANAYVPSLWLGRTSSHDGCPRGRSASCCSCRCPSCRPRCRCPIRFWLESLRAQCPSSSAASSGIILLCKTNLWLAESKEISLSCALHPSTSPLRDIVAFLGVFVEVAFFVSDGSRDSQRKVDALFTKH